MSKSLKGFFSFLNAKYYKINCVEPVHSGLYKRIPVSALSLPVLSDHKYSTLVHNVGFLRGIYFICLWPSNVNNLQTFIVLVITDDAVTGSLLLCRITGIHKPHRTMGLKFIQTFKAVPHIHTHTHTRVCIYYIYITSHITNNESCEFRRPIVLSFKYYADKHSTQSSIYVI